MKNTPVDYKIAKEVIDSYKLSHFGKATIREVVAISSQLEELTNVEFIHMEMGVPGLKPAQVGVDAEIKALQSGIASVYPNINGAAELKKEASRFIKAFIDIDIDPECCVPVTGSMQGTYASFLTCGQCVDGKDTILFIDPGFPVQKQQIVVMGYKYESFDVYEYRGEKLQAKLEEYLKKGNIAAMIYSNPNNPAWFCFTDKELKVIGELANKYDTIVIEDLAYFAMDFRKDLGTPFLPPYQSTVAKYTDNYIMQISGSKAFSYAGQRIGVTAISNKLYHRSYPGLTQRYGGGTFGTVYIHRVLYALSSGTSHSAQFALAAMFKAASDGTFDFVSEVKEYGLRAKRLKEIFKNHGFKIVYDHDLDEPIADGFYFTISYPGMTGSELMQQLIYYGISAISLETTGSNQEGLRACTSFIKDHQYKLLNERLNIFNENHPIV
ncbi:aspartate/methionine/tyrosine aminotransferase [Parabacteroides sp. PF5-5]|uniref:pyridoxal phosphate-dependent aminotransferase n=1 Tax=unclassified Parabacteroides TaxID=2649774 RepID=UPI0024731934|nr:MULTISPECIES: pyridoxal phosphate-dependent aminotransferase [unclassified Parabacteroides]MDH6304066.1 aspartate/methionine/tyrosine aminotransferase [Parabacteroides sp. PH5-39]MDH6315234.1 aspartate/methionine/tyrosine aminotransferase [Parabacteroides sp. PF5-13]MDH6318879.1 aspartate/methionine/tyrosine aminotransferase [Parabacteroides sp. PH5-13]MDH6322608.1 aspartate/methionine/tyrosine aminotransferase [Parabacteroides sp. PH5-8]MDH6326240.1 aspartate/methionine/tyrosine aminotrans